MAEGEGFEPPDPCRSSVFKFYSAFVACRLLLLFNNPNCRKISGLTALLSDNSGFLLCFGIVSHLLLILIFSAFLTAFCRDFVDVQCRASINFILMGILRYRKSADKLDKIVKRLKSFFATHKAIRLFQARTTASKLFFTTNIFWNLLYKRINSCIFVEKRV